MSGLRENEIAALKKLKETLQRDFGLVEMKLIGSKARGDSSPESDLDVVVILERNDGLTRRRVSNVCSRIGLEHDVLLSSIVYSLEEYDSPRTRVTPFYQAVQREGVAV